jgi:hypothetical protein
MMPYRRIAAVSAAAAGLAALAVIPAVPAAAATTTAVRVGTPGIVRPLAAIPADCTLRVSITGTVTLTCTARPATQEWEVGAACFIKAGVYNLHYGNAVTGDGVSTISSCIGAENEDFIILD